MSDEAKEGQHCVTVAELRALLGEMPDDLPIVMRIQISNSHEIPGDLRMANIAVGCGSAGSVCLLEGDQETTLNLAEDDDADAPTTH